MKKLFVFLAALFLVPSLALASGHCNTLTDAEYKEQIAGQSFSDYYEEEGVSLSTTIYFTYDNTLNIDIEVYTDHGEGMINLQGTWSVRHAVLTTRLTHGTHTTSENSDLNRALERAMSQMLAHPVSKTQLDDCNNAEGLTRSLRLKQS